MTKSNIHSCGVTLQPLNPDMDVIIWGEPKIGSHLVTPRKGYTHHGIYIGNGKVIHYSGLADGFEAGPVEEATLEKFSNGRGFTVKEYESPVFSGIAVVERARSRVGESLYSVFSNNCEHFCLWCIQNLHESDQIHTGTRLVTGTVATVAGLAARSLVLTEAVAATGAVGASASAGLGLLATAPAFGMAYALNNTILEDSPAFDEPEREARSSGRTATYVGATVGTAGSIAAVSASGAVAGLSGAGIASGLAALGGGSIAVGAVATIAAPVAAAAAIGYGTYKLAKYIKE
ncbi:lecithin retinol acyltransferase family protein [Thiothrix unzii]|jgi:hypothetical protein|uniref:lecithin retinol acyltransferase family protein n=1 Tax=Thiothrix unzii TaxID=111769 RepID=UPI002A3599BE|nr:lecithin retinol acyltransferase family protein [Thiothrix unzii]MDX9989707.1 lecithin retinol acyltransferase family protein [Thiothrix unzii]